MCHYTYYTYNCLFLGPLFTCTSFCICAAVIPDFLIWTFTKDYLLLILLKKLKWHKSSFPACWYMDKTSVRPKITAEFCDLYKTVCLSSLVLTVKLLQPSGTLVVECCCPCHPTLTLTRSWRSISPPKTCRLLETLSSLSRQRYSVSVHHAFIIAVFAQDHTFILPGDCSGLF